MIQNAMESAERGSAFRTLWRLMFGRRAAVCWSDWKFIVGLYDICSRGGSPTENELVRLYRIAAAAAGKEYVHGQIHRQRPSN